MPGKGQRHSRIGLLGAAAVLGALVPGAPAKAATTPAPDVLRLPAYYQMTKTVDFQNTGSGDAMNVTASVVLLPAPASYAHLTLVGESLKPSSITRDEYGNTVANYRFGTLYPGQTVHLTFTYQVTSSEVSYHLPTSYPAYDTHSALYQTYTDPQLEQSSGVNTDAPNIVALDKTLVTGVSSPYIQAERLFGWVVQNIHYSTQVKAAGGAEAVLRTRSGICTDFADLYAAMLRTDGIPARLVNGYVTNNGGGQGGFHEWVEFDLPGVGWVAADPTWGKYGYFAALPDNWHVPLYMGIRNDIFDEWQRIPGTSPYVNSNEQYTFKAEAVPPTARSVALPLLAAPASNIGHHMLVAPAGSEAGLDILATLGTDAWLWIGHFWHVATAFLSRLL